MKLKWITLGTILAVLVSSQLTVSAASFEVTITNLTRGQQFTPILVASHKAGVKLFELGQPASAQLASLAEEGDVLPLADLLNSMPEVLATANSGGLLEPGASVAVIVDTRGDFNHLSVASMLIPTNDAFIALNGVAGPRGRDADIHHVSVVYDAGSERNDELCASIPGPFFTECNGPGGGLAVAGGEEGFVHVHSGIHGVGNLDPAQRDWRNPAARIVIRRLP